MSRLLLIAAATAAEAGPFEEVPRASTDAELRPGVTGVGRAGDDRFERLLLEHRPELALGFGYAGALDPSLRPGDAVEVSELGAIGGAHPSATAALAELAICAAARGIRLLRGGQVTVDRPVHEPGWRDRLRRGTGAIVVDMENATRQQIAARLGIPFAALAVVSDGADRRLPELRHRLFARRGRIHWARWLAALRREQRVGRVGVERAALMLARDDWMRAERTLAGLAAAVSDWWQQR